jgi:hypothetical protein
VTTTPVPPDPGADPDAETVRLREDATLSLPADATPEEAAAIAAAIGAHLEDRRRAAAAAAAASDDEPERADPWTLAGRLRAQGKRRWPEDVERGEEWRAAARSF